MALSRSKTLKVLISVVWWLWVESACQGGMSTRNGHREEKREEKDFMPCHGVSWRLGAINYGVSFVEY